MSELWTRLEDEPCDGCGAMPSNHLGHGAFICLACYRAWWCPTCGGRLAEGHVCPSLVERAENDRRSKAMMASIGCGDSADDGNVEKLYERIFELEDTIRLQAAESDVSSSYGRNKTACAEVADIHRRRGDDWAGAEVETLEQRIAQALLELTRGES